MKRRILRILPMLLLVIAIGSSVSAATKETYEEEDGILYCWVRGTSTERPTKNVTGYTWVAVRDGNHQVTRLGACDAHGLVGCTCGDFWSHTERLEYKWQQVVKELLVVECRDQAGYSMEGARFILLKQDLERDDDGNPLTYTDEQGITRVTWKNSELVCSAYVGSDGYAKMRFTEEGERLLDPTKEFQQLMLGQILSKEQSDEYSTIQNRWYVNFVTNADGEYEIHSITEAPPYNITDYEELKTTNFGKLGDGFVPEYDSGTQIMYLRNSFRVGKLFVNIKVEGIQGEIPSAVMEYVYLSGPHDYSKRVRQTSTLEDMRMGTYTFKCSDPVDLEGYTQKEPEVTISVTYPVNGETSTLSGNVGTVTLDRNHANAEINVTYTYYPDHVHTWDEGVVTEPTCTEKGYTTYTCTGYDQDGNKCTETKQGDFVKPYGHDYEETVIEATCTEAGKKIYTCVDCGDTYEEAGDPASGHDYETKVTKPACEKEGYTTYTCIHCGSTYRDDYEDALTHDFKRSGESDATCTENGYRLYTCTKCGAKLQEKIEDQPATGHSYGKIVVTEPTCTEKGYTTYTCTKKGCGYSYKGDYKDALGHQYTSQVISPTKEREGYTLHTCSVCGDSYTDNVTAKLSSTSSGSSKNPSSGTTGSSKNPSSSGSSGTQNSGTSSQVMIVKFYDEDNQPLNSGMVALYEGDTQLKSWSCTYDNVAVVDNLEKYVKNSGAAYTLKQSKAMDGYEVSKDSFTVRLQKENSTLKVNVTKNEKKSKGSSVETGRDGKPIVTFYNAKETTGFAMTCQVSVEFAEDCLTDEAMKNEYLQKQYEFTLNWTDEEGEEKTESLTLGNGGSGSWKAELPFGTSYEITATDPEGKTVTGLSENASGVLSAKQMEENVSVEALIEYKVQPAASRQIEMNVVDSETGTPLRGTNFELRDPDGEKAATYISRENGKFYMEDAFPTLGDYLLKQTRAAEGYAPLNGEIPITVSLAYEPVSESNVQLIEQYKAPAFAHQAVSEEEDGSITIKNGTPDRVMEKTKESSVKTGAILGAGAGVLLLAAGGTAALIIRKKKRSAAYEETMEDAGGEDHEET